MTIIKQGLDLPITGAPKDEISEKMQIRQVAILADDYLDLRPSFFVRAGDEVQIGTPLFTCKKHPGVIYTSPAAGKVAVIERGERRAFTSLVVDVDNYEQGVAFPTFADSAVRDLSSATVTANLVQAGLWPLFKTRPFSQVPKVGSVPLAIFVTAMDTNPLAPNILKIINLAADDFQRGLRLLARLTDGKVFICTSPGKGPHIPRHSQLVEHAFAGPHPAGLPGTHIHHLCPVEKMEDQHRVWSIGAQEVIVIGQLFRTGKISTEKIISLAGPLVQNPRMIRTRIGANIEEIIAGEIPTAIGDLPSKKMRIISGSVLDGRQAQGSHQFLGRFHQQISILSEGLERELFGWMSLGWDRFSLSRVFLSWPLRHKKFSFTTGLNGSHRSMVPIGLYEKVLPFTTLAPQLLRALVTKDLDTARALGALELAEEDLALCSFVDPGKVDYGPILRENLKLLEQEG